MTSRKCPSLTSQAECLAKSKRCEWLANPADPKAQGKCVTKGIQDNTSSTRSVLDLKGWIKELKLKGVVCPTALLLSNSYIFYSSEIQCSQFSRDNKMFSLLKTEEEELARHIDKYTCVFIQVAVRVYRDGIALRASQFGPSNHLTMAILYRSYVTDVFWSLSVCDPNGTPTTTDGIADVCRDLLHYHLHIEFARHEAAPGCVLVNRIDDRCLVGDGICYQGMCVNMFALLFRSDTAKISNGTELNAALNDIGKQMKNKSSDLVRLFLNRSKFWRAQQYASRALAAAALALVGLAVSGTTPAEALQKGRQLVSSQVPQPKASADPPGARHGGFLNLTAVGAGLSSIGSYFVAGANKPRGARRFTIDRKSNFTKLHDLTRTVKGAVRRP